MNRFDNKIVLVTGAGSGLGRAAAIRFASEGARVVLADKDIDAASDAAQNLTTLGMAIEVDLTDEAQCHTMMEQIWSVYGRLDVVFANAGIGGNRVFFKDMEMSEWDRVINGNLRSIILTCKVTVPALIEGGGGSIVLMGSSTGGWDTIHGSGPYMTSKEAINAVARNLALELGPHNIRVNAVCPGIIQTKLSFRQVEEDVGEWQRFFGRFAERIPLGRVGQPEDVASAVAFLAAEEARHITGTTLLIDGGQTLQSWSNAPD